jgi:hypothetical protein
VEVSIFGHRRSGAQVYLGFSYTTSQYGLTIDHMAGYELVLPNGTVINVTSKNENLWFALRVSKKTPI